MWPPNHLEDSRRRNMYLLDTHARPGPELRVSRARSHFISLLPSGGGAGVVLKGSRVPRTTLAFDTNFKIQGS